MLRGYRFDKHAAASKDKHTGAPVVLSSADTLRMPLASMSKTTLICGTPRGAGGMPDSSNLPSRLLSFVRERSPSYTWLFVEKTKPGVSKADTRLAASNRQHQHSYYDLSTHDPSSGSSHEHAGLVVGVGREDLLLLCWDGGVA